MKRILFVDEVIVGFARSAMGSAGVQAMGRVLALVLGVILARSLGPEGFGIYAYAFAIMGILMVAAEAGVPTLLMREVAAAEGRGDWGLLRGMIRWGVQVVTFVSVSITATGILVLAVLPDGIMTAGRAAIFIMLFILPVVVITKSMTHALWGLQRVLTAQFILTIITPALIITIVSGLFLYWPEMRTPSVAMAAQLSASIGTLIIAILLLQRNMPAAAKNALPKLATEKWLRSALPFVMIGGASLINTQTDIIMLGWFANAEAVGIYRVATQAALLVPSMTLHIANAVLSPHFARLLSLGEMAQVQHLVTMGTRAMLFVATPAILVLMVTGESMIVFLFGDEFAPAYFLFLILAGAQLAIIGFGQVDVLLAMGGQERKLNRVLWQTALLNVLLNAALIPFFAGIGAAIATSVSVLVRAVILKCHVTKELKLSTAPFRWK